MYNWKFAQIGGVTRVYISSAEDIKHLAELDKKMWTVLSCPVKGLEIDEQSLKYMDTNNDGSIHVDEVVAVSQWLGSVLTNLQPVVEGKDVLPLSYLNQEVEEGKKLFDAAQSILTQLGKEATEISLADSGSCLDSYRKAKFEAALAEAKAAAEVAAPFGEKTADIDAAYRSLDDKVKDYFIRAKLAKFSADSTESLDVQKASIESIAAASLTSKMGDIAAYPLAHLQQGVLTLSLSADINPAWAAPFEVVRSAFPADATELTEAMWAEVGAKLDAFAAYQKSISITEADVTLDEEAAAAQLVDKLLHLTRDYMTLLRNYVTLQDLYNTDRWAIFQAGTLVIDQRTCDLCIKVADAGAMAAQAGKSGMYLITCDCVSKATGKSCKIIAALTVGDVDDIFVGKNCMFYDRAGLDYDAKVTGILENPISIRQAMWTPYKKMAKLISDQIDKFASEKESGVNAGITEGVNSRTEAVKAEGKEGAKQASSFDIAKYAGIFAAFGMAVGMLGTALVAIGKGIFALTWWQWPLVILGIMAIISGPSMFIAWRKLKKRNLASVLNANGWAVNAAAKINIPFGNTLTQAAKYPVRVDVKDPFPEKSHTVRNVCLVILLVIVVVAVLGYCCGTSLGSLMQASE